MRKKIAVFILMLAAFFAFSADVFSSEYEYSVDSLFLTNLSGEVINYTEGSCMANVKVSRSFVRDGADDDFIVIAAYDSQEKLIGFNFLITDIEAGKTARLSALITPETGVELGLVKAFVWDDLSGGKPLSQIKTLDPYASPEVSPEPSEEPSPTASPEPETGIVLSSEQILSVTDSCISARKSLASGTIVVYGLASDVQVYINDVLYEADLSDLLTILNGGYGKIKLFDSDEDGIYDRISKDYYAFAMVGSCVDSGQSVKVSFLNYINDGFYGAGTSITVNNEDTASGNKTVSVTRNGEAIALSELKEYDVIAVRYNVNKTFDSSDFLEIIATDETITGKCNEYDAEMNKYTIDNTDYSSVTDIWLDTGMSYILYLDPFGRIFDFEEDAATKNFAIVERYVNVNNSDSPNYVSSSSSEYSYIYVVTLDGQSKTLYIDDNYESTARSILEDMNIKTSVAATARSVAIADRIIEYTVKNSNGRINGIRVADTLEFCEAEYKESTNRLCKPLSSEALVLDATGYDYADAKTSDYKSSSLSKLLDGEKYDGILIYKNSRGEYCNVIITRMESVYNAHSDFAVAAADFSEASRTEDCYTLYAIKDGAQAAEKLYISEAVDVYYDGQYVDSKDITKGSVFYYTIDEDGFVNQINIVMKGYGVGDSAWDKLLKVVDMTDVVKLPQGANYGMYNEDDWMVTLYERAIAGDRAIQLLLAPVIGVGTNYVEVAPIDKDDDGRYYVNLDNAYDYSFTSDTKIYSCDMSGNTYGIYAFSNGYFFNGVSRRDFDENGYGWLDDDYIKENIQMAFMMVVDGNVTNAFVMNR